MGELEPITILLMEDDPADQKLIKASLRNQKIANDLRIVNAGEEALDFLYHRGNYAKDTSRPALILLDLNMPGMGVKEFLKRLKDDESLKQLPCGYADNFGLGAGYDKRLHTASQPVCEQTGDSGRI